VSASSYPVFPLGDEAIDDADGAIRGGGHRRVVRGDDERRARGRAQVVDQPQDGLAVGGVQKDKSTERLQKR
jgi:hypothetical protein